jgi:hypothetical protein
MVRLPCYPGLNGLLSVLSVARWCISPVASVAAAGRAIGLSYSPPQLYPAYMRKPSPFELEFAFLLVLVVVMVMGWFAVLAG